MASNPYANLVKMLTAVTLLSQPSGTTIKALMAHLGSSRRTIFRLLEALQNLGFPVTTEKTSFNGEKTYRLIESFVQRLPNISLPGFPFTQNEACYLQLLLDRPDLFPEPAIASAQASLSDKLQSVIQESPHRHTESLHPWPGQDDMPTDHYAKLIASLQQAIPDHRSCAIRYHAFDSAGSHLYVINPIKLIEDTGAYYLFASLPKHDSVRLLPLDRIASLEVLTNTFQSCQDATADAALAKSFDLDAPAMTKVEIRFSARLTLAIKGKRFSPFQSHSENHDGSSTYSIITSAPDALVQYVLSCGADAEIIAPANLRSQVKHELASMLAFYASHSKS